MVEQERPSQEEEGEDEYNDLRAIDWGLWQERLAIDLNNLHLIASQHPTYFAEIAALGAKAKGFARRAKALLDLAKSEAENAVRANPSDFGLEKVTEGAIRNAVESCEDVLKAKDELLDAEDLASQIDAIVSGFEHRRSMINNAVALYLGNYWGESAVEGGKDLSTDGEEQIRRRRAAQVQSG